MKKILIVEDENHVAEMIRIILENASYRVVTASNGTDGLTRVLVEHPDLIITDILMPVMDGFRFYKELKKNKLTRFIPVIVLTARGQMEDAFTAYGVDAFLEKPSSAETLLKKVDELLSHPGKDKLKKRILVAGPREKVVQDIVEQLNKAGCSSASVFTGSEVLVQSIQFRPDMIILDIQMAQAGSSAQIIRAIRLIPSLKAVPILTYSYIDATEMGLYEFRQKAAMISTHQRNCLKAGATQYIGDYEEFSFLGKIAPFLT